MRTRNRALVIMVMIASIATAIAALAAFERRAYASSDAIPSTAYDGIIPPSEPIVSEAEAFKTSALSLAIDPELKGRRGAHPRTLATYRNLRAYPGAPPRIPHGLTPGEVLKGSCTTCHERGGYSHRFDAYVPVTPHPEMGVCLQCHVGDVKLMAIPLPSADPSARCRQCHAAGAMRWKDSSTTFRPLDWPKLPTLSATDAPPPIPHSLDMRGNCVACHASPSGVQELRTPHANRPNCRQCHVLDDPRAGEFVRGGSR
jgi:cytochrome c-type protein NapB